MSSTPPKSSVSVAPAPAPAPAPAASPLASPQPWDLVSAGYESDIVPVFELFARDALAIVPVSASDVVLDVAAGPGTLTLIVAAQAARVSAVDFAPSMVERLERRARERDVTNVDVRVGDGQALPFEDASFDAAFSMFGVIFFPDRHRGFSELRRVLRPGGRALVSSWHPFEELAVMRVIFGTLRELMPPPPGGAAEMPLGNEAVIRDEMRAAGFVDVEVHVAVRGMAFENTDALFASFERSNAPLVLLQSRLGAEAWAPIRAKIRAALAAQFGPGPITFDMPAFFGVGSAPRA